MIVYTIFDFVYFILYEISLSMTKSETKIETCC